MRKMADRTQARAIDRPETNMNKETPGPGELEEEPEPTPSRTEEARRLVEEYAVDLRNIIKKLRRLLN
jgi:hypothetical protein